MASPVHKVTVNADGFDSGDLDRRGSLKDVIASLTAILESIPEEHRDDAACSIYQFDRDWDQADPEIEVAYFRPKTAEEIAAESAAHNARLLAESQRAAERERAMLRYLWVKHGPPR